jgi:phage antirepressor YoqD-like protein
MEYLMKENGFSEKEKALVLKFGQIVVSMLVNGRTIKPTEKELFIMQTEIFIRDNGSMIKHVDKELILIKTVQNMSENGKTTNNTDLELSNGLMDKFTRDNIKMEQKLEKEF